MDELLVVRRSIYNEKIKVDGYELIFQDVAVAQEHAEDIPAALTIDYLAHVFSSEEMENIIGTGLIITHFSEHMFLQEALTANIPKDKIIICLDERYVACNNDVIAKIKSVHDAGYKVAVCGAGYEAVLDQIAASLYLIKFSMKGQDKETLQTRIDKINEINVKVLAQDIQTYEEFDICKKLGCTYFEGYFLNLPNLVNSNKVATNRVTTMRLLTTLEQVEISIEDIEEILSQDARLSYKMLRVVNSAAFALSREINSLREAIIYLGLNQIRSWANMIALSSTENKPSDLMVTTMVRAKMAELIADYIGVEDPRPYFTVGLFSTLDAMLDQSMDTLLDEINLADALKNALLNQEGELGCMLQNVIAYEQGDWAELVDSGVEMDAWRNAYLESVTWATRSLREITSD